MAWTIDDPSAHFQTVLWSGSGSGQAITNGGDSDLQPDLVWIKKRAGGTARAHQVYDSSRGTTKYFHTNTSASEGTFTDGLTAFGSDGFTVGDGDGTDASGATYVAWQWKANGGTRTTNAESGNDPGGGYQVNTTAGISIVDYTGTGAAGTMAHGLGAVPEFLIIKGRERSDNWRIGSDSLSSWGYNIAFDVDDDEWANSGVFNSTAPTSSVFSLGNDGATNANNEGHVAYLFKSIQGFSKSGKYTGNADADGPFVYTGFKPAWVMVKRRDDDNSWVIRDSARSPFNVMQKALLLI